MSTIWAETLLLIETNDIGVIYYEFTPYDLRREYQKSYYSSPKEDKKSIWNYIISAAVVIAAIASPIPGDEVVAATAFTMLFQ